MDIQVRLNGTLAQEIGVSRLQMQVAASTTVAGLLDQLGQQYPQSAQKLRHVVPIVAGRHLPKTASLTQGQEVALLLPVAGG